MPPGSCDKEGRTTVAAFRPWRGLPALNPHSLTTQTLWVGFCETQLPRLEFLAISRLLHAGFQRTVTGARACRKQPPPGRFSCVRLPSRPQAPAGHRLQQSDSPSIIRSTSFRPHQTLSAAGQSTSLFPVSPAACRLPLAVRWFPSQRCEPTVLFMRRSGPETPAGVFTFFKCFEQTVFAQLGAVWKQTFFSALDPR